MPHVASAPSTTLSEERLDVAMRLLADAVASARVGAAATAILRNGRLARLEALGRTGWPAESVPLSPDAIFLIASLTKPIVCAGAMLLVQDGLLSLDEPVASHLPEFAAHGKEGVLIRHLMTHTSGLPDQLENNVTLRTRHAPLSEFAREVCGLDLLFAPGTRISYQSMGILMLGEVVQRLTGRPLAHWLRERLFAPLGMARSTLGLPKDGLASAVYAEASGDPLYGDTSSDWGWNSPYWRALAAPWGGLHSTAADLGAFLSHMLGVAPGPLCPAARAAMARDHTAAMPGIPPEQRITQRWGLGWRLEAAPFSDLVSRQTYGHTGATGTLFWADPQSGLACVLLTNQPKASHILFAHYSNAVASAVPAD